MITQTEKNGYDFRDYEGMTPQEVIDTYIVGVGTNERMLIPERQIIIIFLKMVLGDVVTPLQKAQVCKGLGKLGFQRNFVLVVGSLMLILQHIEAYEILGQIQKTINEVSIHVSVWEKKFWRTLPIKPNNLYNTTKK